MLPDDTGSYVHFFIFLILVYFYLLVLEDNLTV